jgi:hypothetical protein
MISWSSHRAMVGTKASIMATSGCPPVGVAVEEEFLDLPCHLRGEAGRVPASKSSSLEAFIEGSTALDRAYPFGRSFPCLAAIRSMPR